MRLSRMSARGSVAVLLFAAVPLFAAMLLLIADAGRIALTRARLQAAADRAAYAGAASLAHGMNEAARQNWNLHKAFRELRSLFRADSNQSEDAARQRIQVYESARDEALTEMETALAEMPARAFHHSLSVLLANASQAQAEIGLEATPALDEREETLPYSYMSGGSLTEPEQVHEEAYDALSHLVKERAPDVSIGIYAVEEVAPLMLGVLREDPILVHAASAAQVFGGSIEDFALKETETEAEAEALDLDEGYDALYRLSIAPQWTTNNGGAETGD